MKKLLLAALTLGIGGILNLGVSSPAFAQSETLNGTVYQVDAADVYVEAADHTAVRVPVDSATFWVNGMPIDYSDLKMNSPVSVHYTPLNGAVLAQPYIYGRPYVYTSISEIPARGTLIYRRDTMENGILIHHVWSNGYWTRQQ